MEHSHLSFPATLTTLLFLLLLLLLPLATLPAPAPEREAQYDWRAKLQKLLTSINSDGLPRLV